ncbi:hypothetical protein, partial [Vibrio cholerae]|uniref:hypothetical protein n=1 Tax=Vibrio cholerae TaxID=666 RepID=UPI001C0FAB16
MHGVAYAANLSAVRRFTNTYLAGPPSLLLPLGIPFPTPEAVETAYAQLHAQHVRVVNNSWGADVSPADEAELDL